MKELDKTEFERIIDSEMPTLVDFYATWCGPCQAQGPIVERFGEKYAGRVNVVKVDVDEHGDIAGEYGVRSIPTLILFRKSIPLVRAVGLQDDSALEAMVSQA